MSWIKALVSGQIIIVCLISSILFASDFTIYKNDYQNKLITPEHILYDFLPADSDQKNIYQILLNHFLDGDSLFLAGEILQAERHYNKGLGIARDLNLTWQSIIINCRLGFMYYWTANFEQAEKHYKDSWQLIIGESTIKDTLAVIESYVLSSMIDITEFSSLLEVLKLDDLFHNEFYPFSDQRKSKFHFLKAMSYKEEAEYNLYSNELYSAEQLLNKSFPGSPLWIFLIRLQQAELYIKYHEFNLALEFLNELEMQVSSKKKYKSFQYFVYSNLGETYTRLRDYMQAQKYYEKADKFVLDSHHIFMAEYHLIKGYVYEKLNSYSEAKASYKIAEQIYYDHNIQDERLAKVFWYLASISKSLKNESAELDYLGKAEEILQNHPDPNLKLFIIRRLGLYYYVRERYDLAIFIFNLVLDDLDKVLHDETYFKSRYAYFVNFEYPFLLRKRAHAFYYISKKNDYDLVPLQNSYCDLKNLLEINLKLYDQLTYEQSKKASLSLIRYTYNDIINIGYELYRKTNNDSIAHELFYFAEKSKAHMLRSFVSDETAKRLSGIPENLILRARIMQKEIDSMQYDIKHLSIQEVNNDSYAINRIINKISEYQSFKEDLEKKYPEYLKYREDEKSISIHTIQEKLRSNQVILEYHFTHNAFYIFYIDKTMFKLFISPLTKDFPPRVLAYRKIIAEMKYNDFSRNTFNEFCQQSYGFYELMIKPVENLIKDKRLIIVPDGELILIPYESLLKQNIDTLNLKISYSELDYLIKTNAISYLYSSNQLLDDTNIRKNKVRYAGFAPDYKDSEINTTKKNSIDSPFPNLPGAVEEVQSISKYFKGRSFLGKEASKERFFKEGIRNEIVHLAMHTIINAEEPMSSQLVFTTEDDPEKQLYAYEVYAQKLTASLIVLSACNTGVGEIVRGEGVFNIARAFIQAGVKDIILTQWSVADQSSAFLMNRFYYYLSEGFEVDVALQHAKIDFLKNGDPVKAHPFYWAGYVAIGNPISYTYTNRKWIIIFSVIILMCGVFWIKLKLYP